MLYHHIVFNTFLQFELCFSLVAYWFHAVFTGVAPVGGSTWLSSSLRTRHYTYSYKPGNQTWVTAGEPIRIAQGPSVDVRSTNKRAACLRRGGTSRLWRLCVNRAWVAGAERVSLTKHQLLNLLAHLRSTNCYFNLLSSCCIWRSGSYCQNKWEKRRLEMFFTQQLAC